MRAHARPPSAVPVSQLWRGGPAKNGAGWRPRCAPPAVLTFKLLTLPNCGGSKD
jgi:hypothetical protein